MEFHQYNALGNEKLEHTQHKQIHIVKQAESSNGWEVYTNA